MWSVGSVVIEMLTGSPLWSHISRDAKEVLRIVANTKVSATASVEYKDSFDRSLRVNYKERESIAQLMGHKLITQDIVYLSDDREYTHDSI